MVVLSLFAYRVFDCFFIHKDLPGKLSTILCVCTYSVKLCSLRRWLWLNRSWGVPVCQPTALRYQTSSKSTQCDLVMALRICWHWQDMDLPGGTHDWGLLECFRPVVCALQQSPRQSAALFPDTLQLPVLCTSPHLQISYVWVCRGLYWPCEDIIVEPTLTTR